VSNSGLPTPVPRWNLETKPFWDATAEGRLVLPKCNRCGFVIWYPRLFCPECASQDVSWIDASGEGTIYSFTITRKGQGQYREAGPYIMAYVELAEGPRIMTNIVTTDVEAVRIGQAVRVTFDETGEGPALPRFTPV